MSPTAGDIGCGSLLLMEMYPLRVYVITFLQMIQVLCLENVP
ncbi:MAG: hypothetical protein RR737_08700 [Lachnospiraceae bacterium]